MAETRTRDYASKAYQLWRFRNVVLLIALYLLESSQKFQIVRALRLKAPRS